LTFGKKDKIKDKINYIVKIFVLSNSADLTWSLLNMTTVLRYLITPERNLRGIIPVRFFFGHAKKRKSMHLLCIAMAALCDGTFMIVTVAALAGCQFNMKTGDERCE